MSRVAALVAIVLVALVGTLTPGLVPAPAATAQEPLPAPVRMDLSAMSPRVVTAAGPPELVVTGTITNTGPDPVDDLSLRVQRGQAVGGEPALRSALSGELDTDDAVPPFAALGPLAPGDSVPFRYAVPLTGAPDGSLALPGPGTYPMLVNLNGTVDGTPSRLAALRTVLPVSSLPGSPAAEPDVPAPTTMLYPISDAPRRIPPVPGQTPVLTDDGLAASFAAGGRLRGLVEALSTAAPAGSPTRASLCLAVDPELVATASAMRGGYEVVGGPDGATVPGRGAEAAGQWLAALQAAARDTCVVALPPSDADLVALVRGGEAELARTTLEQGREALAAELGTTVLDDVVWPADGVLDEPTLAALGGDTRFVLSADGVSAPGDSGVVRLGTGDDPAPGGEPRADPDHAVLADPLLTEAADGDQLGQDLAGTLAFRALADDGTDPLVVAPGHRWDAGGAAATGALSALTALIEEGRIAPAGLPGLAAGPDAGTESARLFYPPQAGSAEIPGPVVATIADQVRSIEGLRGAAEGRTGVGADPAEVFDPLVRGTLRAASSWWRGDPGRAEREAGIVADRIEQIRGSVRVVEPPSPYSLGTSDAPLLVTVANGLPVTMNVRVVLSSTTGLRVAPIPVQAVPPLGRVQVRVSAQVTRSGQFSVDAGLRTPDGAQLGPDTRLRVRSTVYGTVTVWLTAVAGAVLVVLVVRRVVRRIRSAGGSGPPPGGPGGPGGGSGGPGGPGGPPPSEPDGGRATRPARSSGAPGPG
ncbi:hypothetical protein SAMN05216207_103334 [Pseudonocardia ammonioxydans]|uniref:Glycoprotein n=1 Tax=Pseudonocardia ammonioxydans TaxID=260086 RepID=A0A1I5EVQ3_PSUAM|nr:DUF6049 family protein [Pseudonocardia ammonioxydans]SFO15584.1 hypothetical protein SAMN05216207_103334 [Pseudonocardia ammonioxydans]